MRRPARSSLASRAASAGGLRGGAAGVDGNDFTGSAWPRGETVESSSGSNGSARTRLGLGFTPGFGFLGDGLVPSRIFCIPAADRPRSPGLIPRVISPEAVAEHAERADVDGHRLVSRDRLAVFLSFTTLPFVILDEVRLALLVLGLEHEDLLLALVGLERLLADHERRVGIADRQPDLHEEARGDRSGSGLSSWPGTARCRCSGRPGCR